jgi:hypothetical protein
MRDLVRDVAALVRKAERMGLTPLVRLNGTSDVPWENVPVPLCPGCDNPDCAPDGRTHVANIMALFPNVQFYDYTKSYIRMLRYLRVTDKPWPANYSLTFSRSECNDAEACNVLRHGGNVSVVFSTPRGAALPETWHGFPVVDGDVDDARPSDAHGVVVGLRAKGRARRDRSGFVVAV